MMAEISLELIYDDKPPVYRRCAQTTLKAAGHALQILREIERDLTGKPPRLVWKVNIYSLHGRTVIEFASVFAEDDRTKVVVDRALAAVKAFVDAGGKL